MAIKYEAFTWTGHEVKGVLDTDSEETAYELLQEDQLIPYRLLPVRRRRSLVQLAPSLFQPKPKDLIDFTQQMASLLGSGIPLRTALGVQRDQTGNVGLKEALTRTIEDIEGGNRFSDAIELHSTVFPDFYIRLLKTGEATGSIEFTMRQLAENLERRKAVKDRVRSALMYPAITLVIAFIATLVLVKYSLPSLIGLLKEFGGELPTITQLLITITDYAQVYVGWILVISAGALVFGALAMRTPQGTLLRDRILLRIPVVGSVILASNLFILTSTVVALLEAGVPPIEALRLTVEGLNNVLLRRGLAVVTKEASEGRRLGEAFGDQSIFPALLSQGIVVGELRGTQVDTLHGLAAYYQQETDRTVSGATELIQPVVILFVAAIVGFVAVAVISGIYSTLSSVQ